MLSQTAAANFLNGLCGKSQNGVANGRAYIGLSRTEPQANGQGVTEPEGNGYARVQIGYYQDSAGQLMGSPANNQINNSREIHFNKTTGEWGELKYLAIFTAATGGSLLAWGELDTPISPVAGSVVVIDAEMFTISIQ